MSLPPTHLPTGGAIYGTALNHRPSVLAMAAAFAAPPYQAAPKAPVLYLKPPASHCPSGCTIALPPGVARIEIGATLLLVLNRPAAKLTPDTALAALAGVALAADLSIPHASYYRPAIREKNWDGSCPLAPSLSPAINLDGLVIETWIDDAPAHRWSLADLLRPVPHLLADVTDFMTLTTGDGLLIGFPSDIAQAGAGQSVTIRAGSLPALSFALTGATP